MILQGFPEKAMVCGMSEIETTASVESVKANRIVKVRKSDRKKGVKGVWGQTS
jgi:hypothetical protein